MRDLAALYQELLRFDDAEPLLLEALAGARRSLGADGAETLFLLDELGSLYRSQGRYVDARPLYLESLDGSRRVLGDGHPQTLRAMKNLAQLYYYQGLYVEAELLGRELLTRTLKEDPEYGVRKWFYGLVRAALNGK